ncbi:nuclear transport factor 2 family protein [Roseisolibacter sp. H3M3-2]|uniref:nuclear transport factor 2 family protein n=1 Tax=Roseisolibacter sp. H3M3-2 TaxID=3031323 RepID=UPI0023DB57FB|nr:nuclear transport factor 2 family protein [Roseisolibacter sp. H3M3-2]MDF1503291.1 nuclear transport factor 2 family protein [Roseisolibacter sp. H3M3-2]
MTISRRLATALALVLLAPAPLAAQTAADSAAIRRTALDYIEGWFAGDSARMRRALHPDLAKRAVMVDDQGRQFVDLQSASMLTRAAGFGFGTRLPAAQRWSHVQILDVDGDLASVKLHSTQLVDYMHLVRWEGGWRILNVLWAVRPADRPRPTR